MNNTTSDNTQEQPTLADNIKKILNDFNTKLIFIFVSLFVLCNTFITNVIDKYIDRGILSGFNDNIAERILFIVVIALLIYYSRIAIRRNKNVSNAEIEWAFTAFLFWAYYRLISTGWTYVKFWNLDFIYYIDIVLLLSLSFFARRLLYKHHEYEPEGINGFELDLPITKDDQDFLGLEDLAQKLATKIKNTNIKDYAFSIGVESPWGVGKTSFINLLCNHFDKKDTIIIKFNPWDYEKERNLVDAFFLELRENLKKYDSSLSTNLREYAHILSDSNHDIIKVGAKFVECFSSQSIETKRKVINSAIKGIGKLILVIIDDLDRLDKDEIMSVLKLIRNCASFSNMVLVSAYDKEYLTETLKDDVYNSDAFLEKIFQYQFKLPEFSKSRLRALLSVLGKRFIDDSDKKQFKEMLEIDSHNNQLQNNCILSNIDNLRDVYRFINSFKFVYQKLKGDTLIQNLMMIELLRLKYFDVYKLLSKDYKKYFDVKNNILELRHDVSDSKVSNVNNPSDIFAVIGEKYDKRSNDYKQIKNILSSLFPTSYSPIPKAINNSMYIDRYFYYSILDFDISNKEFKDVMKLDYDKIKQHIDVWIEKYKQFSLSDLLQQSKIINAEEYKKVVKSIFYVGYKKEGLFLKSNAIYTLIADPPLKFKENKIFIRDVFFENGASEFVSSFIHDLLYHSDIISKVIFTQEELNDISADMFKLLCVHETSFQTLYSFWENTLYFEHVQSDDNNKILVTEQNEKVDRIFIEYVKTNYKTMLPQLINKDFDGHVFISNTYFDPWNGKEAFMSFVNDLLTAHNDDALLKEFSEFVIKYYNNQAPIPFNFKYIKLNS